MVTIWEEHLFWLEILQDHAYFIRDHLSVSEDEYIQVAQQYILLFNELLQKLNNIPPATDYRDPTMIEFSKRAWTIAHGYFEFEGTLQALRIDNKINLNLSPTYMNGTLAENQEYLRILSYLTRGEQPVPLSLVDLMDLWLEDQLGHAVLFKNMLDPIEASASRQTDQYIGKYQTFIVQNHHLKGYLRFKKPGFPRQNEFALDVGKTTLEMSQFIYSMVLKYREDKLLNKTTLRFLEHHFPETCYFIKKLSYYAPTLQGPAAECSLRRISYSS
ncbi:DUF2935 domain-containing protein [Bacillus sp. BGMRC 2118]|nr:DUF2935 domain-containing protein [Bacillus sp. BGMRC 2118]